MTGMNLSLTPTVTGPDMASQEETMRLVRGIIETTIRTQPRSLQRRIGPSEIGDPCTHCLAAKLAGWEKNEPTVAWIPFIGTAVHAYLERIFTELNDDEIKHGNTPVALCEQTVTVGEIGGVPITGSTDLFLPNQIDASREGMTVDWKIVGDSTLSRVKRTGDPGRKYVVQAHLYARGWNHAGHPTSHVCVYFMPRNKPTLDAGYVWIAPYDERIATDALERANRLKRNLDALETVSTEVRDQWISGLDRDPTCWDCKKYPDFHTDETGKTSLNSVLNLT